MTRFHGYHLFTVILVSSVAWGCSLERTAIGGNGSAGADGWSGGGFQGTEGVGGYPIGSGHGGEGGYAGAFDPVDKLDPAGTGGIPGGSGGAGALDSGVIDAGVGGKAGAHTERAPEDASTNQVVTSQGETFANGWTYYEVQGAVCRDGSAAGYYLREGTSKNLMVFLNGAGVCFNDFFCARTPANVDESLPGETLLDATLDMFIALISPDRQVPPEEGILKQKDSRNPVADWTMVYVPYCTGDVYAGTTPDSPVITSSSLPPQQFMGYANLGLFYQSFGPKFMDSDKVLLAGVSAGGYGALLNFDRTQEFFNQSTVVAITDSGIPFRDQYLEPCLQQTWRDLWGIDKILPADCQECFHADGGGLTELASYIKQKYPGRMLGGSVSADQDEVVKLFYAAGIYDCSMPALFALNLYPRDRYPAGLADFVQNVLGVNESGSYIGRGSTHQHLFRPRYYMKNGLRITLAEWVAEIIAGNPVHAGILP